MLRATVTFWAPGHRLIAAGDLVDPDDDVVEGREDLFESVTGEEVKPRRGRRTRQSQED